MIEVVKRFGLIGDVHTEDRLLEVALDRLAGADAILCVGDLVDGQGDLGRCIELLVQHRALVVRGNHDRWIVHDQMRDLPHATKQLTPKARKYLSALPATRRVETIAGPLVLAHGLGVDDMRGVSDRLSLAFHVDGLGRWDRRLGVDPDTRIHVSGHTHQRWAERVGGLIAINAGTLCRGDSPCFGLLDLEERAVQWFAADGRESERVDLTE